MSDQINRYEALRERYVRLRAAAQQVVDAASYDGEDGIREEAEVARLIAIADEQDAEAKRLGLAALTRKGEPRDHAELCPSRSGPPRASTSRSGARAAPARPRA